MSESRRVGFLHDLVFVDVETTGLDIGRCPIIELAMVHRSEEGTLREFSMICNDVTRPQHVSEPGRWDEAAMKMHQQSGLYDLLDKEGAPWADVERMAASWLRTLPFWGDGEGLPIMAGNSINFDFDRIRATQRGSGGLHHMFCWRLHDVSAARRVHCMRELHDRTQRARNRNRDCKPENQVSMPTRAAIRSEYEQHVNDLVVKLGLRGDQHRALPDARRSLVETLYQTKVF